MRFYTSNWDEHSWQGVSRNEVVQSTYRRTRIVSSDLRFISSLARTVRDELQEKRSVAAQQPPDKLALKRDKQTKTASKTTAGDSSNIQLKAGQENSPRQREHLTLTFWKMT